MKAAMRYAISKQLEHPPDDSSDISSVKSQEYKCGGSLAYKTVPYERQEFQWSDEEPEKKDDEQFETRKTIPLPQN